MSFFGTTDFWLEVAKGNIEGHSQSAVVMRNVATSNTAFTDVWGGGGNMTLAASAESWEIVSSSANDTSGGTGARTVLISSLDANYDIQTPQIVTLNGITAVPLTGTHFRPHQLAATSCIFVLTAGSIEKNDGALTLRKVGGAADIRSIVQPNTAADDGPSKSTDGNVTVPNGITIFGLKVIISWPKGESGGLTTSIKPEGADTARINAGIISAYQSDFIIDFQAKFRVIQKTDFAFRAKADNANADLTVIEEFGVVENEFLSASMAASQSFCL